jgi:hypothetical protein
MGSLGAPGLQREYESTNDVDRRVSQVFQKRLDTEVREGENRAFLVAIFERDSR